MSSSPGTQVHSSQDFWEVVEILKENNTGYLVRWAGLDPETRKPWPDSWVAKEDCTKQLISEWKAKQKTKKRGRKSTNKDDVQKVAKTNTRSQSLKVASKSTSPERHRRHSDVLSPTGIKPVVQINTSSSKRKQRLTNDPSESDEDRPKKRHKTSKGRSEDHSYTIKVGPPGRTKEYVTSCPVFDSEHEGTPVIYTKTRGRANSRSSSSRPSSRNRRSRSISVGDIEDRDDEVAPDNPVIADPPSKNAFSQEIIQETQLSNSTSSQSLRTSPIKDASNDKNADGARRSPKTGQTMGPVPAMSPSIFISQAISPIHSFSSSHKSLSKRSKKDVSSTNQLQDDEIQDDEYDDSQKKRSAFWIFEKQEEEETQENSPEEEGDEDEHSAVSGKNDNNKPSIVNPPRHASNSNASIFPRRRKSDPNTMALTAIIGRVTKVFKATEPSASVSDDIQESLTEPVTSGPPQGEPENENEPSPPQDDDDDDAINSRRGTSSMADGANALEMSGYDEVQDPDTQAPLDEDVEELGPDDAADAIGSSVVESQGHQEINTSLVVNPAETQSLPPPIESPVRQLNSALGLLHRKSEEIQLLRDELVQVQEELDQALRRITLFEQKLSRAEEQREVRDLQIAGLQAELVAARSEAAVKVVQNALSSPPDPSDQDSALDVVPQQDSEALDRFREEVDGLKVKVTDLDRENMVLRNLYAQASNSHMDNLEELRQVKRENASLREQATTGVRQANVFWQTQISTLERKVKQTLGASELLVQQNRATESIRERAALLPIAQKETEKVREELGEWKDRFAQLGMENTSLRIELKGRDDADMARRRKEREMEEHNKRLLESHGDQLVWICQWRDEEYNKCGALLDSRDSLREHCHQAGHI